MADKEVEALKKEKNALEKEVDVLKKRMALEIEAKGKFESELKSQKVYNSLYILYLFLKK
jgi:hypothetical protein